MFLKKQLESCYQLNHDPRILLDGCIWKIEKSYLKACPLVSLRKGNQSDASNAEFLVPRATMPINASGLHEVRTSFIFHSDFMAE